MNSLLHELFEQAHVTVETPLLKEKYQTFSAEKFAELIIKECSRISTETAKNLKDAEEIHTPGLKTIVNLYMIENRQNLVKHFDVNL